MDRELTRAKRGMMTLSWFHFAFAIVLFIMCFFLSFAVNELGAAIHRQNSEALSFLDGYDDQVTGLSAITILVIEMCIELFLGFSCRKKAKHPEKLLLTIILSGGKAIYGLISILLCGTSSVGWIDAITSLVLNTVTFLLAIWLKTAYDRHRRFHGVVE